MAGVVLPSTARLLPSTIGFIAGRRSDRGAGNLVLARSDPGDVHARQYDG
jgi:hypothetical protein